MNEILRFPDNFLWGVATSAHQIEGNNIASDWWAWEHSPPRVKKLESIGAYPPDFQSGKAADHWNRYKEDIELMKKLAINAYRCSIEWAKIEPQEGVWDMSAIDHYREEFQALNAAGITIVLTLHHVTLPLWAAQKGGWASKEVAQGFVRFAQFAFGAFKKYVDYWITINEPLILAGKGYLQGAWPPNKKRNLYLFLKVLRNQVWAHKTIFSLFHAKEVYCQVGIAKNNQFFGPIHPESWFDRVGAIAGDFLWNKWFLRRLGQRFDFIGLNYYFYNRIHFPFMSSLEDGIVPRSDMADRDPGPSCLGVSDMGWTIFPAGIENVLLDLARYGRPILITENGVADRDDRLRKDFIRNHLYYVHRAIGKGANVQGYFYWSLLDNFEWDRGFAPRFGLYEVDYTTFERTPRPSAAYYGEIAKHNGIAL